MTGAGDLLEKWISSFSAGSIVISYKSFKKQCEEIYVYYIYLSGAIKMFLLFDPVTLMLGLYSKKKIQLKKISYI